jgi:hypothetical protein
MSPATDRGRTTHRTPWVVGLVLVLLIAGGWVAWRVGTDDAGSDPTAGAPGQPLSRELWVQRTAELLERAVWVDRDSAVVIMPATSRPADDLARAYDLAIGVTALGPHAPEVVADLGFASVQGRLEQDLTAAAQREIFWEDLLSFYVAREVLRADQLIPGLMTDPVREMFTGLVDEVTGRRPVDWHSGDVRSVVDVSRALGYREADVAGWAERMGDRIELTCEAEADLAYLHGAMVAGLPVPCDDQRVIRLWDQVNQSMLDQRAGSDQDCFTFLALTETWHARWPEDTARRSDLITLLEQIEAGLAGPALDDIHYCLRDLQPAGDLLGQQVTISEAAVSYLRSLLRSGGVPQPVQLSMTGFPEVVRLARLTGGSLALPDPARSDAQPVDQLGYLVEGTGPGAAWSPEVAQLVDELAAADPDESTMALLMRTLAYSGEPGCDSAAISHAGDLARAAANGDRGTGLGPAAHAVRGLSQCGEPLPDATAALVAAAEVVLGPLESGDRPSLTAAADAVTALCALSPGSLPDQQTRWNAYTSEASPAGGAATDGDMAVSLPRTLTLAETVQATTSGCHRPGVVG